MTEQIQPTPAELKLIEIKREQDKLERQKLEAEQELRNQSRIEATKMEIENYSDEIRFLNTKIKDSFNELKKSFRGKFVLKTFDYVKNFETRVFITTYDDNGERKLESKIIFSEDLPCTTSKIVSIENPNCRIYPVKYNRQFRLRLEGCDYKSSNTNYVNVNTCAGKIESYIASQKQELFNKNLEKLTIEIAQKQLSEKYPHAKVSVKKDCKRSHLSYSKIAYNEYIACSVEFENGIRTSFTCYKNHQNPENPSFSRPTITIDKGDALSIISSLENLKF